MVGSKAIDQFRVRIHAEVPDLDIRIIEPLGAGNNNDVVLVNGTLVFRFARHKQAVVELERETALLRALAGRSPLAVPEPLYVAKGVVGYIRIPGVPLTATGLRVMGETEQQEVAQQLAAFLGALHGVPLVTLPDEVRNAAVADTYEARANLCERIRTHLLPLMRPQARSMVAEHLDAFLVASGSFTLAPALRHGDFGPSNILYDPATNRLTGVIDFASAAVGDPAIDIASSMFGPFGYGEEFLERVRGHYFVSDEVIGWARLYAGTFALQEALIGAEQDDADALHAGLAGYV